MMSGAVSLLPNLALADAPPAVIAQRIESLKQSAQPWIEIDLSEQHLIAWSGKKQIFTAIVSTGKATTPTYAGIYTIQRKYPQDRMRGADYDIPNVPNVMYFDRGYALHGADWHNNFGTAVSHGCINLPINNAQWLFNWSKVGTSVIIHE
ncbi:MAG: L,D-transpeptidase [Xenococcaceae cyanobacterium]